MVVAYSTRTLRRGNDRLVEGAEQANAAGFRAVHAATPPTDATAAKGALDAQGVALVAVSTQDVDDLAAIGPAIDRAAAAASVLRRSLVLLEIRGLCVARRSSPERDVETLVRSVHAALRRHNGLTIGIATPDGPGRLLGVREIEWLLSELRGEPIGLALDAAGALRVERSDGGTPVLAQADRFGSKTLALFVHGLGGGEAHARPDDDGPDWGTLRGLVPARAPRILDLSPSTTAADVEESRRFVEHVFRDGA